MSGNTCMQVRMPMCVHAKARGEYQESSIILHLSFWHKVSPWPRSSLYRWVTFKFQVSTCHRFWGFELRSSWFTASALAHFPFPSSLIHPIPLSLSHRLTPYSCIHGWSGWLCGHAPQLSQRAYNGRSWLSVLGDRITYKTHFWTFLWGCFQRLTGNGREACSQGGLRRNQCVPACYRFSSLSCQFLLLLFSAAIRFRLLWPCGCDTSSSLGNFQTFSLGFGTTEAFPMGSVLLVSRQLLLDLIV